ncbi:Rv3654c family TadE-like protein [Corynebacterium pacaense]|uniref:Rv3654c family TadE-like protein n=1 Tax=Corynebacterium pacaense TaxID=1816684 RepID=UPI0009BB9D97|nr:Rv3654c family TadE-like protein [Corynebacterium pacaense]
MPCFRAKPVDLRGDRGYATVAAAGFSAALVSMLAIAALQMSALVAREQAQVAADLAAVAGAGALAAGVTAEHACGTARETAEFNGAELRSCAVEAEDLIVAAQVRGRSAGARAGPL